MKRVSSLLFWGILVSVSAAFLLDANPVGSEKQKQEVLEVLKKFQAGYTARDVAKVDEFLGELFDPEDIMVVGTSSHKPGQFEWCEDIEAVKKVIVSDWENWGDLVVKIDSARIRIAGNVAWVTVRADSIKHQEKNGLYDKSMKSIMRVIERNKDDKSAGISREILFWITRYGLSRITEYELGDDKYIHPLRLTAVIVKKKKKWLIRQMNFSFPTQGIPDVRVLEEEEK